MTIGFLGPFILPSRIPEEPELQLQNQLILKMAKKIAHKKVDYKITFHLCLIFSVKVQFDVADH